MPLTVPRTKAAVGKTIAQIMRDYHASGKIGNITPSSPEHAAKIADAIAFRLLRTKGQ